MPFVRLAFKAAAAFAIWAATASVANAGLAASLTDTAELPAVKKTLDRTRPCGLFVKYVKDRLDRSDHNMQRNAAILPRLDQRPIKGTQKQILPAAADKRFLDLGEVVIVIQG